MICLHVVATFSTDFTGRLCIVSLDIVSDIPVQRCNLVALDQNTGSDSYQVQYDYRFLDGKQCGNPLTHCVGSIFT